MSGKDHKKSAVHFRQRVLTKEHNPQSQEACTIKVGSEKAARTSIVKQLLDLGYTRLSPREFIDPETGRVRVLPRK